jgi:hypothetical protein
MSEISETFKPCGMTLLPEIIIGSEDRSEGLKTWTPAALDAMAKANKPDPVTF